MKTRYDLVVVGCGPAGMAGAIAASGAGLSVLVLDEQPAAGGQIWRNVECNSDTQVAQALGKAYREGAGLVARLHASSARTWFGAQVWQIEDRFKVHVRAQGRAYCIEARAVLLATGAQERPNPFPGWTLPGVMTLGGAQILIKNSAAVPSGPVWIAGTGPLPLLYMAQLLKLGGKVAGFINTAPAGNIWRAARHVPGAMRMPSALLKGAKWMLALRRAGVPFYRYAGGLEALGDQQLETIRFGPVGGDVIEAPAQLLLTHEGVVPSVHASLALGCKHDWHEGQLCLVPRLDRWGQSSRDGLFIAGDGGGIGGAEAAVERGTLAGIGIALSLGAVSPARAERIAKDPERRLKPMLAIRPFLDALYKPRPALFRPDDATLVCRCECLTAGQIRQAALRGAADPNQVKAATRAGMGPCQGRQCGYTVVALVEEAHNLPMGSVGFFHVRPPLKPITLGEIASLPACPPTQPQA